MNIDQLISAYLDGDLTPEQDELLRAQISADHAAHDAFDAAVILHISMCCEDRTEVPPNLRKLVFEAIEGSAVQVSSGKIKNLTFVDGRKIGALVAMLFLFCLPITDSFLELNSFLELSDLAKVNEFTIEANAEKTLIAKVHTMDVIRESPDGISRQSIENALVGDDEFAAQLTINHEPHSSNFHQSAEHPSLEQPTLNSFFNQPLTIASQYKDRDAIFSTEQPGSEIPRTPITLSTVYATGFGSAASGATDISQVAASIGYEMGKEDFVGLEFGATSYSVEYTSSSLLGTSEGASLTSQVPINVSMTPQASAVQIPVEQPSKLASPDPVTTHYSAGQFTTFARQSTVWGTAFYERRLITLSSLSLNARAAAGVSEDGVLGYGRILGEWEVGGVVSLVIGSELRTMPFRTGTRNNNQSAINYGTILTGLTGIHVRF
ncbi:MAG: hypothetical protein HYX66_10105 [Ignavibacteria bacterium]|nr:hypothetical protein [Ignavibacteria bacterium]